jgi:Domain of unknown function (DUF4399)
VFHEDSRRCDAIGGACAFAEPCRRAGKTQDGATIKGAFWCRFGLRNMGVTHAGDSFQNSGHHHLLIDVNEPINPSEPIPQDKSHLHFGAGQTEARIELPPGKHTLQLVLGDAAHYPFNPPLVSDKITIRIK